MSLKALPNIVTSARIGLAVVVFALLAAAGGRWPGPRGMDLETHQRLILIALVVFVVAALTDFLDGWLARKLNARSAIGVMLDPIADKIAVVAAVIGLCTIDTSLIAWPGALILMRELFVAGLRETGVKLAVTPLAKWKTTGQLMALAGVMAGLIWSDLRDPAQALLWIATALTLWTGADYLVKTLKALKH